MNLNRLYELQAKLDKHILDNNNVKMSKEELLDNTILALLVEVGELANTTRCFKHWSKKGMMEKKTILDEYADCLHFYLSIGNQVRIVERNSILNIRPCVLEHLNNDEITLKDCFLALYNNISNYRSSHELDVFDYKSAGEDMGVLIKLLNFTDEEVENAYLKKHKENYKRQREGY